MSPADFFTPASLGDSPKGGIRAPLTWSDEAANHFAQADAGLAALFEGVNALPYALNPRKRELLDRLIAAQRLLAEAGVYLRSFAAHDGRLLADSAFPSAPQLHAATRKHPRSSPSPADPSGVPASSPAPAPDRAPTASAASPSPTRESAASALKGRRSSRQSSKGAQGGQG